jgi:hypothetical protein
MGSQRQRDLIYKTTRENSMQLLKTLRTLKAGRPVLIASTR